MPRKRTPAAAPDAPSEPVTAAATMPSNVEVLARLLVRPQGATVPEMVEATGWQVHSVRGAMSGILKAKRKLAITSTKTDGVRTYRATPPEPQP